MKPILTILLIVVSLYDGNKLAADSNTDTENNVIFEKVYLHVDRELYSVGDDIWFKSYLINGFNNRMIPGYKNIYVQLVTESGDIVDSKLLVAQDGFASGDFSLKESLKEGTYFIRAYTKYQTNFGEEGYFHKKIFVAEPKRSLDLTNKGKKQKAGKIDISFLPEGGNFVLGAENVIAFKAVNEEGRGIPVKGTIVDDSGNEVTMFESEYKGMGRFELAPEEGKSYFARIENYPEFTYTFEAAKPDAVTLNCESGERGIFVFLKRNPAVSGEQDYVIQATHKNTGLFNTQVTLDESVMETMLFKQIFPAGISKIALIDLQGNIISERLVFVGDNKKETIQFRLDKSEYNPREKVELEISTLLARNDVVDSALSIAVVNENYFGSSGISQTIQSYLLLDSELKGHIESPASCFIDDENMLAEEKLDLVMLVNGWRSYYWDELYKYQGEELPGWEDLGLSFHGKVTRILGKKPMPGAEVLLSPYAGGLQVRQQTADEQGNFSFDRVFFKDSALIIIDAVADGGNRKVDIKFEQPEMFNTNVNEAYLGGFVDESVPLSFKEDEYKRLSTEREYKLKADEILMEEVEVFAKRTLNDGHYRIYGEPDVSLQLTDDDIHHLSILDYLEERIPGVDVGEHEGVLGVRIRGGKDNPQLVIDGVPVMPFADHMFSTREEKLRYWLNRISEIRISDVDKVEILKSGFATVAFGAEGGDGVLSIFTKVNNNNEPEIRYVPGRITPIINGYHQPRQFYSPKYTPENIATEHPDFRPTLIWVPNQKINGGSSKIEFYTSDESGRYRIIAEGISEKGKVCFGTGILNVAAIQ